jgi:hypothetical protein
LACVEVGCSDELDKANGCTGRCSQAAADNPTAQRAYGTAGGCILDECVTRSGRCTDDVAGLPPQDAPGQPAGSCVACRKAAALPANECAGDPSCGVCHTQAQACTNG